MKPGSPGHAGQEATARATEVWKSRTFERSRESSSTLTANPAVFPANAPPSIVTLTSAHWPRRRVATAPDPFLPGAKRTRS